ncbi:MAG: hypothetical protein ACP5I3_10980 [Thermoproteus sp.]
MECKPKNILVSVYRAGKPLYLISLLNCYGVWRVCLQNQHIQMCGETAKPDEVLMSILPARAVMYYTDDCTPGEKRIQIEDLLAALR